MEPRLLIRHTWADKEADLSKCLKQRKVALFFVVIFALALIVRLVMISQFGQSPRSDLLWNDAVGWNLANGLGFTASETEPRVPGIMRTPVYPAFLAVIYFWFGHSYFIVFLFQALLDSLSAILIGLVALNYVSVRIACTTSG